MNISPEHQKLLEDFEAMKRELAEVRQKSENRGVALRTLSLEVIPGLQKAAADARNDADSPGYFISELKRQGGAIVVASGCDRPEVEIAIVQKRFYGDRINRDGYIRRPQSWLAQVQSSKEQIQKEIVIRCLQILIYESDRDITTAIMKIQGEFDFAHVGIPRAEEQTK
jgi:hypothetical protein